MLTSATNPQIRIQPPPVSANRGTIKLTTSSDVQTSNIAVE